jgi:hypothetical protein
MYKTLKIVIKENQLKAKHKGVCFTTLYNNGARHAKN